MKKIQIAVIGVSDPTDDQYKLAEEIGALIAKEGWILINGGLSGVMEASSRGASEAGGTVIGVLPTGNSGDANPYVSIPIVTNMGHARNCIIVQSADACVAIGQGLGTLSEIGIALKEGKLVVNLDSWDNIPGTKLASRASEAIYIIRDHLL